ncbi:MAG: hypothetical protein VKK62_02425 [Synechococcaceae cyanobacterium]|nr:hypothetical protein [Synechococcaceae cyanobacterium]
MRQQALSPWRAWSLLLAAALVLAGMFGQPQPASAATVLQVRDASLLQVGDGNRSFPVQLACLAISSDTRPEALAWLRRAVPRGTALNLRPLGASDGTLVARVSRLPSGDDLSEGLIAAGLAETAPCG